MHQEILRKKVLASSLEEGQNPRQDHGSADVRQYVQTLPIRFVANTMNR
jgi:hypothetical protein